MAYAATSGHVPSTVAPPGVLALQRALVWLVGASRALVFIEPSLRLRLLFMPLVLLLVSLNVGYSIGAVALFDDPVIASWIATSWYMAFTAIFFAMVVADDTAARLDML